MQWTRAMCAAMVKNVLINKSYRKTFTFFISFNILLLYQLLQSFIMKHHIAKAQHQSKQKLGNMAPKQQSQAIQQAIQQRIRQHQTTKIRNMSLSQINDLSDKEVDPPMDSRTNKIRMFNMKMGVTEDMIEYGVKTPGERHLQILERMDVKQRVQRGEKRMFPIYSQIKRGRLGIDNLFIAFALLGGFMLPLYFINKFRKNRVALVQSRIATPQVIACLDEDSPISIDDVSQHTIHYFNPDSIQLEHQIHKFKEVIRLLEKELYF